MIAISNAFFFQAEVEETDRWKHGPLEFIFFDSERHHDRSQAEVAYAAMQWNREYEGGCCRDDECIERLEAIVPGLRACENPNIFLAPRECGFTQLEVMLASVVPTTILERHGIRKQRANFSLLPFGHHNEQPGYGVFCQRAFEEYIWTKLQRSARCRYDYFAKDSPLRLLAADSRYWMSRLFRIALARYETFPPTTHIDETWQSLDELQREFANLNPESVVENFKIRRPRVGGDLWDIDDADECDDVVEEMLDGLGLMEPVDPLLDLLQSNPAHEDFSPIHSWIKEDFERAFYSKRAKVKVVLTETIDEFPAWEANSSSGHDDLVFRDILSCFDLKEQRLLIALRHGKTTSEIAREMGLKGHASVSRKLARIKKRVRSLLE